jgi:hypothetical protein
MTSHPMMMLPLAEFVAAYGRLRVANLLGCTGPALANAIRAGRTIFVEQAADGVVVAVELRRFPGR